MGKGRVVAYGALAAAVTFFVVLALTSTPSSISQPPQQSIDQIKSSALRMPFEELARRPEPHLGQVVTFRGKVIQALYQGQEVNLRINVTPGDYGLWKETVLVMYAQPVGRERILEGDIVRFWGNYMGIKEYKSVIGATVQLPAVSARAVEASPFP